MQSNTRARSRYWRIVFFFAPLILGILFWDVFLPRLGLRRWARATRPARLRHSAAGFRRLAVRMGGVMIKLGQFLSTRLDVLPEEVTAELAGLQDDVPAESFEAVRRLAEAELGAPLEAQFETFDPRPLAAASLGQAHRARLRAGELRAVVVKVQRPNIEAVIATDLAALRTVGEWVRRYPPVARRADVRALLAEFTRILGEEVDYLAEGRNAETFAAHFKDRPGVRVPQVVWAHTTRRVLTLEDVQGIKLTDYAAVEAAGLDRAVVARRLFETYLQQIFDDGFFHADPHPGNLFVEAAAGLEIQPGNGAAGPGETQAASPVSAWRLTFVDFGMIGRVPPGLRAGLREAILGLATRDPGRLVKAAQLMGVLLPGADLSLLEQAETRAFEIFGGKNMGELRRMGPEQAHALAVEYRELLYALPFQIPEDLILLGRTVGILSGMCTGLDPQFNVWTELTPYATRLAAEEATRDWRYWAGEAGAWLGKAAALPGRLDTLLGRLERGELEVRSPDVARQLDRAARRVAGVVLAAALFLGGVQLWLGGQPLGGWASWAAAAVALAASAR